MKKLFSNKHYVNLSGMAFLGFISGRMINNISGFSGYAIGQSIVFPIVSMLLAFLILFIPFLIKWYKKQLPWKNFYVYMWLIWGIFTAFMFYSKHLTQYTDSIRN